MTAMPTAASSENSPARPPVTDWGTWVSTASRSVISMSDGSRPVSRAIVTRTFSIIPPMFVPGSPRTSRRRPARAAARMISSAPASTSTSTARSPSRCRVPAGMRRSVTSPAGVLMTTAERLPTRARAIGTTAAVSEADRPKRVAMP